MKEEICCAVNREKEVFWMEPITINDMHFKGIRMLYSHLEKGIKRAKNDRIKEVCIWQSVDQTRYNVNFDFLKDLTFIETFHFLINLSKKSNLEGLYSLTNLRDFRWVVDNVIDLDFSRLTTIEKMNTRYYDGITLEHLTNLKELYLNSLKSENLEFLPELENLDQLRIISAKITSLEGLERCKNLKKLDLRSCYSLVHVDATLHKLDHLESIVLDSCKKHDINVEELKTRVPHVWIG
jgi:hypothetical protein